MFKFRFFILIVFLSVKTFGMSYSFGLFSDCFTRFAAVVPMEKSQEETKSSAADIIDSKLTKFKEMDKKAVRAYFTALLEQDSIPSDVLYDIAHQWGQIVERQKGIDEFGQTFSENVNPHDTFCAFLWVKLLINSKKNLFDEKYAIYKSEFMNYKFSRIEGLVEILSQNGSPETDEEFNHILYAATLLEGHLRYPYMPDNKLIALRILSNRKEFSNSYNEKFINHFLNNIRMSNQSKIK